MRYFRRLRQLNGIIVFLVRKAAQKAFKRVKVEPGDSDSDDFNGDDSDYEMDKNADVSSDDYTSDSSASQSLPSAEEDDEEGISFVSKL